MRGTFLLALRPPAMCSSLGQKHHMDWTHLIAIGIGIATTIGGAYIVHVLTHDRWWKEYRLRKLEELYMALRNHELVIAEYYTRSAAYLVQSEDAEGLPEQNEILRNNYLAALQEDEKQAAAIPMIANIYFDSLTPAWDNVETAKKRLSEESRKAIMLNKDIREALGKARRESISKTVGLNILQKHLPELSLYTNEMLARACPQPHRF